MSERLQLQHHLCFKLYTGSRLMQRIYRPYFEQWGITYPQYLVLVCLWQRDGLSVGELADPLDLDSGTLSPLLKRMEERGFVRKEHVDSDFRKVHVFLTDKGAELRPKALVMQETLKHELGLAADDLESLERIMAKLTS
ncbi:MarR family winged helix-turn-helix transcriptional regulator [Corynebacterium kozikiae]|uniref:MarR family winged helix-turn-helix transcriptional regulator n=1 Tax=Corynebacterium kozikiae TaxID=2968469 RepID=UPI00211C2518|nr:MarR family transcriptional regulator [Corynebacterium sp. 76QC2CO]MCQ9343513.1 MarR family transcriptional regulator [Corynebacterium sp. 76QC2CO]